MKPLKLVSFVLALLASLATTASAAGIRIQFAEGEGTLKNREGQEARFAFGVRKAGERPAEGRLHFATRHGDGVTVTLASQHLPRLEVRGDEAWFGGTAVLEVTGPRGHRERVEGHLRVHVRDNVVIDTRHDRTVIDVMELEFVSEKTGRTYSFGGRADPRSIHVGTRLGD